MARVIFQAQIHNTFDCEAWVEIPDLCLQHCVLDDFKSHPQWRRVISSLEIDDVLAGHIKKLFGEV